MKSYLDDLPKPFFVLAPMDDVTDTVFRRVIDGCASPDLYFTEFVNADGLQSSGRLKLIKKLQFTSTERPIVAQLWGKKPENYYKTAQELVGMGFDGVDINMGCPVKTVVKNGACAALINNQTLAGEIIQATTDGLAGRLPLSVKTRIGFNDFEESWLRFLLGHKLAMLSIHLRSAKEMSKVPARWELMSQVKEMRDTISPSTVLVGNGDVENRSDGEKLAEKYGLDGIMIGRGVFADPFVFAKNSPWEDYTKTQKIDLYARHTRMFANTWQQREYPIHTLNKFCKIYINGFDGAKEMREDFMQSEDAGQLLSKLSKSDM